jgi:RNA polymerase sigma factor (sigma-70 family)
VALFRAGHEEAFRVIHDRYRQRLFAYARQMLPLRQDAEDALQDIFVRAYAGLRANNRELALRAWLYRVAHNRCIDELRRPAPPPPEVTQLLRFPVPDPIAQADQRESLRRLIADVRRLPDQQRSALLMRELGGMSYAGTAGALGVTIPAVKSLLVRARLGLAQALEARDASCADIREELILAHDRARRPNSMARRHMRDCAGCQEFRHDLRGVSRRFGAIVPTLGPLGVLANLLGVGGAGGSAVTASGAAAAGGAAGGGSALASVGSLGTGAGHVATLLAAAVVTAGGAVEIQHTITTPTPRHHHQRVSGVAPVAHPAATQTPTVAMSRAPARTQAATAPAMTAMAPAMSAMAPAMSAMAPAMNASGPAMNASGPAMTGPPHPPAPGAPAAVAPAAPGALASPAVTMPPIPSTSTTTTTTTTFETKPTGGPSAGTAPSTTPATHTVALPAAGGQSSSTAGATTTTPGTNAAPTLQAPTISSASAQTSTTVPSPATGSTAPPNGPQTTTQGTGSPAVSSSGGSQAPQQ